MNEFFARFGVDNRRGGPVLWMDILRFDLSDLVEQTDDRIGRCNGLVQTAQEGRRGQLRGLVDAHREHIFLGDLELDP